MIKHFTIYGERCSGTNFLFHAIKENFNLDFTSKFNEKHFFGFHEFIHDEEEDNTLFISIIRNPITWIDSFIKKPFHIPIENKINIESFLFNSFYSIFDDTKNEIMEDRNIITKERYKNIFELRYTKNNFLINEMPKKVKNYLLIRYEDLRDNYETVLNFISDKFKLIKKNNFYVKIDKYKGHRNFKYVPKPILLKKNIINIITKNISLEQENSLGYLIKQG
jgi:hypothetical protein